MTDALRQFVDSLTADLRDEAALTDAVSARIRADIARLGDLATSDASHDAGQKRTAAPKRAAQRIRTCST